MGKKHKKNDGRPRWRAIINLLGFPMPGERWDNKQEYVARKIAKRQAIALARAQRTK